MNKNSENDILKERKFIDEEKISENGKNYYLRDRKLTV